MFSIRLRALFAFLLILAGAGWVITCCLAATLNPTLVATLGFASAEAMKHSMYIGFLPMFVGLFLTPTHNQISAARNLKKEKKVAKEHLKRAQNAEKKTKQQRRDDIKATICDKIDVFGSVCELHQLKYDQSEVLEVAREMVKLDGRLRLADFCDKEGCPKHVMWIARHMR